MTARYKGRVEVGLQECVRMHARNDYHIKPCAVVEICQAAKKLLREQGENFLNQMGCLRIYIEALHFSSRFSLDSTFGVRDSPKLPGQYTLHNKHISKPKTGRFDNKSFRKSSCHHNGCISQALSPSLTPFGKRKLT